jgi:pimeloyl-CoA dehydrogenase small subunit
MDFDLNEEQRLLKQSVDRLIADHYDFAKRSRYSAEPEGWSAQMWSRYAEMGLLGLPFAEADGGFGGGPVETMIVMEALGRGLVLEPYFATVVLCGALLRHAATDAQRAPWVSSIADGTNRLAFAQVERQSRYVLADVSTRARPTSQGWSVDGAKSVVVHGDAAHALLVSARVAGDQRDRNGIGLFLVDAGAPGVVRRAYPTQDGQRAAEIIFENAPAIALGDPGTAIHAIEHAVDEAIAGLCAEAVGAMAASLDLTVAYLKTRRQFGRAIGEFQALQHRAVDMYVLVEQARSMALLATMAANERDATSRRATISAAKAFIGRASRRLGQEAVQLHGGIGMTMEYSIGHYFKRLTMIDLMFGDADSHVAEVARLGGLIEDRRDPLQEPIHA